MVYTKQELIDKVKAAAAAIGFPESVAVAQIQQESGFNPNAQSPAGAEGLAQFMPGTWAMYGSGSPFDPDAAIAAWQAYISKLMRDFPGRPDLVLAGYNSGENRSEYKAAWREGRPVRWSVMPAGVQAETQNYVNRILSRAGYTVNFQKPPAVKPGAKTQKR